MDEIINIFLNKIIHGSRSLGILYSIPSEELSVLGVEKIIQSKMHGKISLICTHILNMNSIEIKCWIQQYQYHSANITWKSNCLKRYF